MTSAGVSSLQRRDVELFHLEDRLHRSLGAAPALGVVA
jgi:hypothetical protein